MCLCVLQEEVAEFSLGLCCAEEERGETPGREDSPSDLGETELDPGGDPKTGEDKAFGRNFTLDLASAQRNAPHYISLMTGLHVSLMYEHPSHFL